MHVTYLVEIVDIMNLCVYIFIYVWPAWCYAFCAVWACTQIWTKPYLRCCPSHAEGARGRRLAQPTPTHRKASGRCSQALVYVTARYSCSERKMGARSTAEYSKGRWANFMMLSVFSKQWLLVLPRSEKPDRQPAPPDITANTITAWAGPLPAREMQHSQNRDSRKGTINSIPL